MQTSEKKHVKPRKQGEEGGIISVEVAIPSSKANVVCPKCGKATKIGYSEEKRRKSSGLEKMRCKNKIKSNLADEIFEKNLG